MTKNDWGSIIAIIAVVGVAGFFLVNAIMDSLVQTDQTIVTAEKFDANIVEPSPQIYNSSAINPTVEVKI